VVIVSCPGKFHAFSLAEQLNRHQLLTKFYTGYAYQKNTIFRHFANRIDKENIPREKIATLISWAIQTRLKLKEGYRVNNDFDSRVARRLKKQSKNYRIFIGWASISLVSLRQAKSDGKITILERGSTHISYQNEILHEEYRIFGKDFKIDHAVIDKELLEYEEADYISVPSMFVKQTFLERGTPERKLVLNPYGAGKGFVDYVAAGKPNNKFIVVYLGTLSIRKGLLYLFQALEKINVPKENFEAWFIGAIQEEMEPLIAQYRKENWKFWGHVGHYDLHKLLSQCDVGIQPSIEEGMSMVIPQMMASGLPVIITPNTGGTSLISEGINGFVIPIRAPRDIASRIELLFNDKEKCAEMKVAAAGTIVNGFTWDDYGNRYTEFINSLPGVR
jgi:glycosyltransferase involved in cell wall biosynthesis